MTAFIRVSGARVHNLKNIHVSIPRDRFVVVTGLSGSGKSSLAFDTIFAEGQRRYIESLSAYARQFLEVMEKPDVDAIEGLSPTISIDQKSASHNPRSTVGTVTEIHDYLRLLFARVGQPHCPRHDLALRAQSAEQIVEFLLARKDGRRVAVLAPLVVGRKGEYVELFANLAGRGFARARVDGEIYAIEEVPTLAKTIKHTIEAVVDRVRVAADSRRRLLESIETAAPLGDGAFAFSISKTVRCASFRLATPALVAATRRRNWSRNCSLSTIRKALAGAAAGLGMCRFSTPTSSSSIPLCRSPPAPFAVGIAQRIRFRHLARARRQTRHRFAKAVRSLAEKTPKSCFVWRRRRNRNRRRRQAAQNQIRRRRRRGRAALARNRFAVFARGIGGAIKYPRLRRLRRRALVAGRVGGQNRRALDSSIRRDAAGRIPNRVGGDAAHSDASQNRRASRARIAERVRFLINVGLDYLSLSRAANTLSGGEAQRIRLAGQVGSG